MNIILYDVSNNILNSVYMIQKGNTNDFNVPNYSKEDMIFFVPLGIIFNNPILTNISPKIPYKIDFLGSVDTYIDTKVTEYGINNSLIEVMLNVNMNVQVIFPFISKKVNINKNIPISSNVIQGKIPTYYGGVITNSSPINSKMK